MAHLTSRRALLFGALALAAAVAVVEETLATAQSASPSATPPASEPLVHLTLPELASDRAATLTVSRFTIPPGASLRLETGSGPTVAFLESGTLRLTAEPGLAPPGVVSAEGLSVATAADNAIESGGALMVPAGSSATLQNSAPVAAVLLELLTAGDASVAVEDGVERVVAARAEATLPEPPVTVSLERATIARRERLPLPGPPVVWLAAGVDRGQATYLSPNAAGVFNRSPAPMEIYILTVAPAGSATPEPG